ncbi:MAG: hypothetical protein Q4E57_01770 [Eubacteriales bacterium]|nr:hypothetical protein [Eubacteriales bacterium]
MSLTEILCAVVILVLVTGGVTTAVTLGARQFNEAMRSSQSQVLCSTVQNILSNELRYSSLVHVDGEAVGSDGASYGKTVIDFNSPMYDVHLTSADSRSKISIVDSDGNTPSSGFGYLQIADTDIISDSNYPYDLGIRVPLLAYDEDRHIFTVELEAADVKTGKIYATEKFQVRNANNISASTE